MLFFLRQSHLCGWPLPGSVGQPLERLSQVPRRQQSQNVDMARQPEHLLQSGAREETECTNRSFAYRQGCFEWIQWGWAAGQDAVRQNQPPWVVRPRHHSSLAGEYELWWDCRHSGHLHLGSHKSAVPHQGTTQINVKPLKTPKLCQRIRTNSMS